MNHDAYKALYIHIPFCIKRCSYCDFTTKACKSDSPEIDEYIQTLCLEIRRNTKAGELAHIETIYIGGGTPSYVGTKRLSMLFYTLSTSIHILPQTEWSMEANPESLNEAMVRDIWALGVNRLSIGVQSFDDTILQTLGRAHTAQDARVAIYAAKTRFDNVSIDLMCGIPGQSEASFEQSVKEAIDLGISHISIYPLTIEPHTPFFKAVMTGKLPKPDEDVQAAQMQIAARFLSKAGFRRYEVASYAKPGFECKHNLSYWSGVPYLGLGKSAATMTQNKDRRMRMQDDCVTDDLNKQQMCAEDIMLAMRTSAGVSKDALDDARVLLPDIDKTFDELIELGLVERRFGSGEDEFGNSEDKPGSGGDKPGSGGDKPGSGEEELGSGGCELASDGEEPESHEDDLESKVQDERFVPTEKGWLCGNELYGLIYDLAP